MGNRQSSKEKKSRDHQTEDQAPPNAPTIQVMEIPITENVSSLSTSDSEPQSEEESAESRTDITTVQDMAEENFTSLELIVRLCPTSKTEECLRNTTRKLQFLSYPKTGKNIKKAIENELEIPVCLQTLSFESQVIFDDQQMSLFYFQDGDVLTVEYMTQGDLKEVHEILKSMKQMVEFLESKFQEFSDDTISEATDLKTQALIKPPVIESLVDKYFHSHDTDRGTANRLYFVHNGGIETTFKIHKLLSDISWTSLLIEMQYLEYSILRVFIKLSVTIGVRCLMLQNPNCISQLSRSIMRQPIFPYQKVEAPCKQRAAIRGSRVGQNALLTETMFKAMWVISNLAELPSCRLHIAMQTKMIEQMTSAMLSPSYSLFCASIVISTLLSLSYTHETHKYLTSPQIIHGVLAVCKKITNQISLRGAQVVVIKYFTTLFFSIISTATTDCVNDEGFSYFLDEILSFMQRFLCDYTYEQVREAEKMTGFFWTTYKPIVNLVYFNYERHLDSKLVKKKPFLKDLYLTSIRSGIFSLKNMCLSDQIQDILEKEKLTDFFVCLPWYVPNDLKVDARIMVQLMSEKIKPNPPLLVNIVKARLATLYIPLNEVMSHSSLFI